MKKTGIFAPEQHLLFKRLISEKRCKYCGAITDKYIGKPKYGKYLIICEFCQEKEAFYRFRYRKLTVGLR